MEEVSVAYPGKPFKSQLIKSKYSGAKGMYKGDIIMEEVPFVIIEFNNGKKEIILKEYIESL